MAAATGGPEVTERQFRRAARWSSLLVAGGLAATVTGIGVAGYTLHQYETGQRRFADPRAADQEATIGSMLAENERLKALLAAVSEPVAPRPAPGRPAGPIVPPPAPAGTGPTKAQLGAQTQQLTHALQLIDRLRDDVDAKQAENGNLTADIDGLRKLVDTLRADVAAKGNEAASNSSNVDALGARLAEIERARSAAVARALEFRRRAEDAESRARRLQQDNDRLQSELDATRAAGSAIKKGLNVVPKL